MGGWNGLTFTAFIAHVNVYGIHHFISPGASAAAGAPPACCHNLSSFHCVWWSHTGLSSAFATPWEGGSLGEGPGGRPEFLGGCRAPPPLASPSPEFPS